MTTPTGPRAGRRVALGVALAALVVLAGCGGATDPATTAEPTTATTAETTATTEETTATTAETTAAGDGDDLPAASERRFGLSPTATNNATFVALLTRVNESDPDRARRLADRFVADGAATAEGRAVAAVLATLPPEVFGLTVDAVLDVPTVNDTVLGNLRLARRSLQSVTYPSQAANEGSRFRQWVGNLTDPDADGDGVPNVREADPAVDGLRPNPVAGRVAARLGADGETTDLEWRVVRTATRTRTLAAQVDARDLSGRMAAGNLRGLTDPDGDNATTVYERGAGTDPDESDTDGDGFSDGAELFALRAEGADPTRPDLFVELDTTERTAVPDASIERIREYYAENGLAVHFVRSDDDLRNLEVFNGATDAGLFVSDFDRRGLGYVHVVAVLGEVRSRDERVGGYTEGDLDFIVFQSDVGADEGDPAPAAVAATTHVLAHELGHALGLFNADYKGIDSFEVSADVYRSVMNYNSAPRLRGIGYSEGEPFDDWAEIRADRFGNPQRPSGRLDRRIETGENVTVPGSPGRLARGGAAATGPSAAAAGSTTADPARAHPGSAPAADRAAGPEVRTAGAA